ncbi:hypothetical protein [Paraflavitalea speifideaquila]|uniref:hypothetical protein n=1 Tax=Paraflavitalea speifideaquila TaxID=3076558 RepID=UPI0028E90DB2|nr:hypothetical protein [Paraflavitalea speifideiaquila]
MLYRLDVSEPRLKQLLAQETGTNAGELIAALIVERQLEKSIRGAGSRLQTIFPMTKNGE